MTLADKWVLREMEVMTASFQAWDEVTIDPADHTVVSTTLAPSITSRAISTSTPRRQQQLVTTDCDRMHSLFLRLHELLLVQC